MPVGIALRVGPYHGPFPAETGAAAWLSDLAASLVADAEAAGVRVKELQLDFDCAESKLDGYRVWVETIRKRIAPVPLTITALPCWLRHENFRKLAAAADGYILQVHSLERPDGPDAKMTLCDAVAAKRAVERAASFGLPFRVALPTYGHVAGFDPAGKLLGLSAEGPAFAWPAGTLLREVRADPWQMTGLVRAWTARRPAPLQGIIWYRLPTERDRLTWKWPTLAAVMDGRFPCARLRAEVRRTEPALAEIDLINDGDADDGLRCVATVDCAQAGIVAADALNGFELINQSPTMVRLRGPSHSTHPRLGPGERKVIGWLRTETEKEIKVHVVPLEE